MAIKRKIGLLVFLMLLVSSFPASAATFENNGTVVASVADSLRYDSGNTGQIASDPRVLNDYLNYLGVNFDAYKYIHTVDVSGVYYASTTINRASSFTAYVGGVYYGSGVIGFQNDLNSNNVTRYYVFNHINSTLAESLTGNRVMYLEHTINMTDIHYRNIYYRGNDGTGSSITDNVTVESVSPSQPVLCFIRYVYSGSYFDIHRDISIADAKYKTSVSNTYKNLYNYTRDGQYADVVISKGSTNSKWTIYSGGAEYINESTFNTNGFRIYMPVSAGSSARVLFQTGLNPVERTIVFEPGTSCGTGGTTTGSTNATAGAIYLERDQYFRGERVNITYAFADSSGGKIRINDELQNMRHGTTVSSTGGMNATWSYFVANTDPLGEYTVSLYDSENKLLANQKFNIDSQQLVTVEVQPKTVKKYDRVKIYYKTSGPARLVVRSHLGRCDVLDVSVNSPTLTAVDYIPTQYIGSYNVSLQGTTTVHDGFNVESAELAESETITGTTTRPGRTGAKAALDELEGLMPSMVVIVAMMLFLRVLRG